MADQNLPHPNLISSTRQDLSASFLEASFGILGNTFAQDQGNPQAAEPFVKLGANIASTLHDRWYKQEYENFQASTIASFQQAASGINNHLSQQMSSLDRGELLQPDGSITKIDPKSEGFLRTKDTVIRQSTQAIQKISDQFLQDAAKYANNPYISGVAQNLMQSQANYIAQATGPTPAQASEGNMAKIEETRAHTRLMNREPAFAPSGGGKENTRGDPRALLQELGPPGFMEMLVGSPRGREFTKPYQTMAAAQIKTRLLEEDPNLEGDEENMTRRMGEQEQAIQNRAAGLYMKTVFPELTNEMSGLKEFEQYFGKEPEKVEGPKITGLLSAGETKKAIASVNNDATVELDRIIRAGGIKSIDQAINQIVNKWLPRYLDKVTNNKKNTEEFRKDAKAALIQYLSDEENWGQVDIARERFGKPRKGILDRAKDVLTEEAGDFKPRPEYSGKGGGLGGKPGPGVTGKGLYK
jgi:hypothetical protein